MNRPKKTEVPKHLVLASLLSTGITGALSVCYTILSILGLVYRFHCDRGSLDSINGADYFFNLLFRVYIRSSECNGSVWPNLTQDDSVFVLNILTLCCSLLCCVAAVVFLITLFNENGQTYLHMAAYAYVATCAASLVVDITFGTHFGTDYSYLTDLMSMSNPGLGMNYERDLLRLGAFLLMTICLKGFVAPVINCVLLGCIVAYVIEYRQALQRETHSIHKLGALNAYDQNKRWQAEPEIFMSGGPQINPAYIDDMSTAPRSPRREPASSDYTRSDSWQNSGIGGSRPFSYLEEPRRGAPNAPSRGPSSAGEPAWRRDPRDWPAPPPPVPAPDYSPNIPRRLKPALKTYNY